MSLAGRESPRSHDLQDPLMEIRRAVHMEIDLALPRYGPPGNPGVNVTYRIGGETKIGLPTVSPEGNSQALTRRNLQKRKCHLLTLMPPLDMSPQEMNELLAPG